jgi:hypothetical protein
VGLLLTPMMSRLASPPDEPLLFFSPPPQAARIAIEPANATVIT